MAQKTGEWSSWTNLAKLQTNTLEAPMYIFHCHSPCQRLCRAIVHGKPLLIHVLHNLPQRPFRYKRYLQYMVSCQMRHTWTPLPLSRLTLEACLTFLVKAQCSTTCNLPPRIQ